MTPQISISEGSDQVILSRKEYEELWNENLYLKHELEKLKKLIFGSKSERFIPSDPNQLSLDILPAAQPAPAPETEQISYTRKKGENKNGHARLELPSHLRREIVMIEPEEDITGAKKIGEVITEVLNYIPGNLYVTKYIRIKYALPEEKGIVIGQLPSLPIPRGNAGASLLSHLLISKFVDHLPFYRQVQMFKRNGIHLAESTINDWFRSSCNLLFPLYECLRKKVVKSSYLMADETPIAVLTEDKPGSTHKGFHWVYYSPVERLILFEYQKGRGQEGAKKMLHEYKGALQTDGYTVYNIFEQQPDITLLACMAHARRKFDEAKSNDKARSEQALTMIQKLYDIERMAREASMDKQQRHVLRNERAPEILSQIHLWLKENINQVLPKSAIGQAIAYTLHLWPRLERYIQHPVYEIDNNLIENAIRPVALGRKNYMFAGSHEAAQRAAMMYSFLATCKINQVEPFEWLTKALTRLPDHSIQRLDELLPGNLQ